MPRTVKCGLIQAKNAASTDAPIEEIKRLNVEKHLAMIEDAERAGQGEAARIEFLDIVPLDVDRTASADALV